MHFCFIVIYLFVVVVVVVVVVIVVVVVVVKAIFCTINDPHGLQGLKDGDKESYSHFLDHKRPTWISGVERKPLIPIPIHQGKF